MRSKRAAPEVWQKLRPKARDMRHDSTAAEERLWEQLRGRKLRGRKFRRQHAIDRFVVDFYCAELALSSRSTARCMTNNASKTKHGKRGYRSWVCGSFDSRTSPS